MKLIWVMYNSDTSFNYISSKAVVFYLPGYKGGKNELPFLRNFIIKNKKMSFFYLSYSLQDENNKKYKNKNIILELEKNISTLLNEYHFKECYLIGYSFGAALALKIASRKIISFNKLILISIFDDRKDLLLEKGVNINDYENISPINLIKKNKEISTFFIHGSLDASVSMERGLKVYNNSSKLNNKFIVLPVNHYFDNAKSKKLLLDSVGSIL